MKEEKPQNPREDEMIQKCIDPVTGRDITTEYISQRLAELEIIAIDIVNKAIEEYKKNPNNLKKVFKIPQQKTNKYRKRIIVIFFIELIIFQIYMYLILQHFQP